MPSLEQLEKDTIYMRQAIILGEQARLIAPPNPWVGCLIVKDGHVLAQGHTQTAGGDHAETVALTAAAERAQGATVYVSLEPCAHYGKTPPCVKALIQAKIGRVVVALEDPDARVNGRGLAALRQAGISVTVGTCAEEATQSLKPYLHHRKTGLPYCILKSAVSIDGRTAAADGSSQWITSDEARSDAHSMRAYSQAIAVGSRTAQRDNPLLTVRHGALLPAYPPLRVILNSSGCLSPGLKIFANSEAPTLIATSERCSAETRIQWEKSGAEVVFLPTNNEGIDLQALLQILGQKQIIQLLVEGGGALHSSFIKEKLFNQLTVYLGACILGPQGLPAFSDVTIASIHSALRLQLISYKLLSSSVRLDYIA